jgi:hypothetical protein
MTIKLGILLPTNITRKKGDKLFPKIKKKPNLFAKEIFHLITCL